MVHVGAGSNSGTAQPAAQCSTQSSSAPAAAAAPAGSAHNHTKAPKHKLAGNASFKQCKLSDAIKHYTAACNAAPGDPVYLANLSAAHFERGSYSESIKVVKRALKCSPAPELATRLVLRAVRCQLWRTKIDAAQKWLQHPALQQSQQDAAVTQTQAAFHACSTLLSRQDLSAIKEAWHTSDAPPLVRAFPSVQRNEVFLNGHDPPISMLDGARLRIEQCNERACTVELAKPRALNSLSSHAHLARAPQCCRLVRHMRLTVA